MKYFLKLSLENKLPITIIYLSGSGSFSKRKILVRKISDEKIMAYCYLRKEIRTFSVKNVLSAGVDPSLKAI
ncbi:MULTISPECIES: hypothetical protein [Bacillaceae]|uniref:hypothetical protein n=1 Tax=Bacillaceae TaxID=186817 RepID=UPI001145815F|nr:MULTISPECIES: hypothetical protein [Bacillaceae]UGB32382.1 hypothetical protein LPC09_08120 [Metabacillus sp. B2-18]